MHTTPPRRLPANLDGGVSPASLWRRVAGLVAASASLAGFGATGAGVAAAATEDPARAAAAAPADGNKLVEPSIILEQASAAPGQRVGVAMRFRIAEGWHVYWPGINDSGAPLEPGTIRLAPVGEPAGEDTREPRAGQASAMAPWQWPAPSRHVAPGDILDYVFEGELVLLSEVTIPSTASPGQVLELATAPNWLVCSDACIPGKGTATARVKVSAEAGKPDPAAAQVFAAARARLPREAQPADGLAVRWTDSAVTLTVAGAARLMFAPAEGSLPFADPISSGSRQGDTLTLRLSESPSGRRLSGVLTVTGAGGRASYLRIDSAPPAPPPPPPAPPGAPAAPR